MNIFCKSLNDVSGSSARRTGNAITSVACCQRQSLICDWNDDTTRRTSALDPSGPAPSLLRRQPPYRSAVEAIEPLPDRVGHSPWIASSDIRHACPNEIFDVKALFRRSPPGIAVTCEDREVLAAERDVTHGEDTEWSPVFDGSLADFLSHA